MTSNRITRFLSHPVTGWHDGRPDEASQRPGISGLLSKLRVEAATPLPKREEPRLIELAPGFAVDRRRLSNVHMNLVNHLTAALDDGDILAEIPTKDHKGLFDTLAKSGYFVPVGPRLIPVEQIQFAMLEPMPEGGVSLFIRLADEKIDLPLKSPFGLIEAEAVLRTMASLPDRLKEGDVAMSLDAAESLLIKNDGSAQFSMSRGAAWNLHFLPEGWLETIKNHPFLQSTSRKTWTSQRGQALIELPADMPPVTIPGHVRIASNAHINTETTIAVIPKADGLEIISGQGRQRVRLSNRQANVAINRLQADGRLVAIGDALVRPDRKHSLSLENGHLALQTPESVIRIPTRDKTEAAAIYQAARANSGEDNPLVPHMPAFGPHAAGDALLVGTLRVDPARLAVIQRKPDGSLHLKAGYQSADIPAPENAYDALTAAIDPQILRLHLPNDAGAAEIYREIGLGKDTGYPRLKHQEPDDWRRSYRELEIRQRREQEAREQEERDRLRREEMERERAARRQEMQIKDRERARIDWANFHEVSAADALAELLHKQAEQDKIRSAAATWWQTKQDYEVLTGRQSEPTGEEPTIDEMLASFKREHKHTIERMAQRDQDHEIDRGMSR